MNHTTKNHWQKPPQWMYLVAYVIPYLALAAIAFLWPAHSSPWGLDFTQSPLARMVPSISAYIDKSAFPHAIAAYFVMSGVLTIPYLILAIKHPTLAQISAKRASVNYEKYTATRLRTWLVIGAVFPVCIWILWIQPGYQPGIFHIREQRWALAISGFFSSFYSFNYFLIVTVGNMMYFEKLFRNEREYHGVE